MAVDLDAIEGRLTSPKPKRRMRQDLPALIAELRLARAVIEAADALLEDGGCRMGRSAPCGACPGCVVLDTAETALAAYRAGTEGEG